jgi:hypothetical protein
MFETAAALRCLPEMIHANVLILSASKVREFMFEIEHCYSGFMGFP